MKFLARMVLKVFSNTVTASSFYSNLILDVVNEYWRAVVLVFDIIDIIGSNLKCFFVHIIKLLI